MKKTYNIEVDCANCANLMEEAAGKTEGVTSGGSRRRECPASAKKPTRSPTGAVCRSCITLPVSTGASPTRRENRSGFPGSKVPGAGTLPVGFQGRSALVAEGEIPTRKTCTRR